MMVLSGGNEPVVCNGNRSGGTSECVSDAFIVFAKTGVETLNIIDYVFVSKEQLAEA